MFIKFLPGDLVEFDNQSILITSMEYSKEHRSLFYHYFQTQTHKVVFASRPYPYDVGHLDAVPTNNLTFHAAFWADFVPPKKISHLFDFNIYSSAICQEGVCFPRRIMDECSGCPLGSLISSKVSNLYLPGDQVYMITEKKVKEVTGMCLTIKSHMTDDCGGGFANFRPDINSGSWYLLMFARMFATHNHIDYMTLPEAWEILKQGINCETKPRYYIDGEKSGRWGEQIRLRFRGRNKYLNESDLDTVCGICIYQRGMEICDSCSTEKLREQIYG